MKILDDIEALATKPLLSDPDYGEVDHAELTLTEKAGRYLVEFARYQVGLTFDRLTETAHGSAKAELTVRRRQKELIGDADFKLKDRVDCSKVAGALTKLAEEIPWERLLERARTSVLRRYRDGEPVIILEPAASAHVPFLVNPLIFRQHQTLLFAPGGSLKSYLALWLALLACHGQHQAHVAAVRCPVLYLDWELNRETVGGRLKALRAGHPELSEFVPYYRRCEAPLHQEAHQIAGEVASRGVELLIVDSAAMACGSDLNSPESAIKLQRALRQIGCASLVLAHVSKSVQDGQERTAYGSVFFRELARNVWELQRAEDTTRILLSQMKNNFGAKQPPLGFEFLFTNEAVRVAAFTPEEEPAFEPKLPLASRIRNLLEDGELWTAHALAGELGEKPRTVTSTLSKHRGIKWQLIGENRDAKWTAITR